MEQLRACVATLAAQHATSEEVAEIQTLLSSVENELSSLAFKYEHTNKDKLIGNALLRHTSDDLIKACQEADESRRRYQDLVGNINEVIFTLDEHDRLTFLNPAWTQVTGLSVEECLECPIVLFLHLEDRHIHTEAIESLRQKHSKHLQYTVRARAIDGTWRWLEAHLGIERREGKPITFSGTLHDVTERRHADAVLMASEARYHSLFENMLEGFAYCRIIFENDEPQDFIYLEVNRAFESLTGLKNVTGKNVTDAIPGIKQSNPETFEIYGRVASTGRPEQFEAYYEQLSAWLSVSVYSPAPGYIVAVFDNVTERKQARETLKQSEEMFRSIFSASTDAIILADREKIFDCNDAALALFGCTSRDQLLGHHLADFSPHSQPGGKNSRTAADKRIEAAYAYGSQFFEWTQQRLNGTIFPADVLISRFELRGKTVVQALIRNITERKQTEENALRTQRMEAIGSLAGGIAHDLNNILAPILMGAPLLYEELRPEMRHQIASTIEQAARRGADVVRQVLTFARGLDGQRTALNSQLLIHQVATIVCETFPKSITFTTPLTSGLWNVIGDQTQLHQVLLNLCVNARDAMPHGGSLSLTAENCEVPEVCTNTNPDCKPGRYVSLNVVDSGTGIPREIIAKIFDPFFTTKEIGKGTGLGLSTVIGIVKSHGGFVTVDSEPGKGSKFSVFLPATTAPQADLPQQLPNPGLSKGSGELLMIVDDEKSIGRLAATILKSKGYKVEVASSGEEALAIYATRGQEIELVITDLSMPEMDGVALTRALKELNPTLKIMGSTGHADETLEDELRDLGVTSFLTKPYNAEQLLTAVHRAIQG